MYHVGEAVGKQHFDSLAGAQIAPVEVTWQLTIKHAAAAKSLQSCLTLCDPIYGSQPGPWDSPGKNTGVGCHFLLQSMKVKSESEVAQSCPALSNPMDSSLPGSSTHGIFQARALEWGAIASSIKHADVFYLDSATSFLCTNCGLNINNNVVWTSGSGDWRGI